MEDEKKVKEGSEGTVLCRGWQCQMNQVRELPERWEGYPGDSGVLDQVSRRRGDQSHQMPQQRSHNG